MSTIAVTNTSTQLSGKTIPTAEGDYTITGEHTFDRDPSPPFVVTPASAVVPNLDADKLDGQDAPTGTIVGTSDTQTLSNKTLVAPTITGALTLTTAWTFAGGVYTQTGSGGTSVRIGGLVTTDSTQAATGANTTATTLYSYTLPANSFDLDGRVLRFRAWGSFAANGNTKTVSLKWNGTSGTSIMSYSATPNNQNWVLEGTVIRTGSHTQDFFGTSILGPTAATNATFGTATATDTAAITLHVVAQNGTASASDIVYEGSMIEFIN